MDKEAADDEKILHSEHEIIRREKFEAILKLQKENSGLIEPKRDIAVLPGMFLPQPVTIPQPVSAEESADQLEKDAAAVASGKHANRATSVPSSSGNRRKHKGRSDHHSHSYNSTVRNPSKSVQQWVRKDDGNSKQKK